MNLHEFACLKFLFRQALASAVYVHVQVASRVAEERGAMLGLEVSIRYCLLSVVFFLNFTCTCRLATAFVLMTAVIQRQPE